MTAENTSPRRSGLDTIRGIICGCFVLVLLYMVVPDAGLDLRLAIRGERTTGMITGWTAEPNRWDPAQAPTFSFTALNGMTYGITSTTSSELITYEPGTIVNVVYDSTHPEDALIDTFYQRRFDWILFGAMAFGFGWAARSYLFPRAAPVAQGEVSS